MSGRIHNEDYVLNKPLWNAFHQFCYKVYSQNSANNITSAINPENVFEAIARKWPVYRRMRQQDSHEFLRLFLEALDDEQQTYRISLPRKRRALGLEDTKEPSSCQGERKPRMLESIFGGKILSCVKCRHCGYISKVEEPFMDLSLAVSLPLQQATRTSPAGVCNTKDSIFSQLKNLCLPGFLNYSSFSLESLLENLVQVDPLNENPCYECEKCSKTYENAVFSEYEQSSDEDEHDASDNERTVEEKEIPNWKVDKDGRQYCIKYRLAEKWERIAEFPNILVIHLNRFMATGFRGGFSKNTSYVSFPEHLYMDKYSVLENPSEGAILNSPQIRHICYQLYATIVHCGSTADSGHYIAMVKSRDDQWYRCSDSSVRPAPKQEVFSGDAYILFYQKMTS